MVLVLIRLFYPYELEWIEGAYVNQAIWVSSGRFPYVPPTLSYLPTSKTPFFFYIAGLMMKLSGNDSFFSPRLVSIFSLFGTLIIIFILVSRVFQHSRLGFITAGLYAATFQFTGSWMDLAKTDSLCLFLILFGFFIGVFYEDKRGQVFSGLLFVFAFYTKQITLPVVLVMAPISLLFLRGRNWLQWVVASVLGLTIFWLLDFYSQGWFSFYTFQTSLNHNRVPDLLNFWKSILPKMLPAFLIVIFYGIAVLLRSNMKRGQWPERDWQFLGFGLGLLLASWSIYLKVWTYKNGLMPAVLGLVLLSGVAIAYFVDQDQKSPTHRSKKLVYLVYSLLFLQFFFLLYNPKDQLPSIADRRVGDAFITRLSNLPGQVWIVNHSAYTPMVEKPTFFHSASYSDVATSAISKEDAAYYQKQKLVKAVFDDAIRNQRLDWLIIGGSPEYWMPAYVPVEELYNTVGVFMPVTGAPAHPEILMAPNPVMKGGNFPITDPVYDVFFEQGWTEITDEGRWILGEKAVLKIALLEDHDYDIHIDMRLACKEGNKETISIEIGWNDFSLGDTEIESCNEISQSIDLPSDLISRGLNNLWFISSDPTFQIELQNLVIVEN
jgi:hypothetical protein